MGVVIDDLLRQMSLNPFMGGDGNAIAAQAGGTNAGFYPMNSVADKNRMDAGKGPMPAPKPVFDVNRLLSSLMAGPAAATGMSAPMDAGRNYDPVAKRWYTVQNGQKVWLDNPQQAPMTAQPPAPMERPLIDQSVIENAPWFGVEQPQGPQPYQSPYQNQISQLQSREAQLYDSMMQRTAPHRPENPLRPGAAGLALVTALLARAAGAKPDFIGQVGQGFLGGIQSANENRYANQMADYEQGANADKMRLSLIDQQLKAMLGAEDDARSQWNADRNYNENVRQFDETNARIQSEGEANRASKFNAAQAKVLGTELSKWQDVYTGKVKASADDRNIARGKILELTDADPASLPYMTEGSSGYQKDIANVGLAQETQRGRAISNNWAEATFDDRVKMVAKKLEREGMGLRMDENKLAILTKTVENFPQKLQDDHLKAVAAIGSLDASATLARVKAKAGGFAPASSKLDRATIANKASAIKTILSTNSSRIGELQKQLAEAQRPQSLTASKAPALQAELSAYLQSQYKLKETLSGIVGVDLTPMADQSLVDLIVGWASNPNKAIADANGGIADRLSRPPQPEVTAPGVSSGPTTVQELKERYDKNVKKAESLYGKGTEKYNQTVKRLNTILTTETNRLRK